MLPSRSHTGADVDRLLLDSIGRLNESADEHVDAAIATALQQVRECLQLQAVAVFKLAADHRSLLPTHGDAGSDAHIEALPWELEDVGLPAIVEAADVHGFLLMDGPSELVAPLVWARLQRMGVGSALVVPYRRDGAVRGLVIYFGDDRTEWPPTLVSSLRFFGEALHGAIRRAYTAHRMGAEVDRYFSLYQSTPQPVWCYELDTPVALNADPGVVVEAILGARLIDANAAFLRLFDAASVTQLGGKRFSDMMQMPGVDVRALVEQFVHGGCVLPSLHYEVTDDNGHTSHLRLRGTGIVRDGHLRYVWGSSLDVTDRVESEMARASVQERMDRLMAQCREGVACFEWSEGVDLQSSPDALAQLREATVVEASDVFARFFGFHVRADVIGRRMMDVFGGELPDWFSGVGQAFAASGYRLVEQVVPIGGHDGLLHARVRLEGIFEGERLRQIWSTVRDASREVAAQQALERSERAMAVALQAAELHTLEVDLPSGTVELGASAPRYWVERLPRTVADGIGFIVEADRERVMQAYQAFIDGDADRLQVEFRVAAPGGDDERCLEVLGTAVTRDEHGTPVRLTGLFRDVSQRRLLDARMRSSQRLEGLGVLAGGIAHDFNNLLMSVLGHAQLSRRRLQSPDSVDESLREIERAALRAAELCDALLAYAGRGSYRPQELRLDDLVTDTRAMVSVSLPGVTVLHVEPGAGESALVRADRGQLQEVIVNLALNASESYPDGAGKVTVRTGIETLSRDYLDAMVEGGNLEAGPCAYLEVEDAGEGMTPDVVERIFDPFFTTRFAGRGLGMASVLGAVRGHRGAIEIHSRPGRGTRVRVWLPVVESLRERSVADAPALRGTVLVVDDESGVRQVVCDMLSLLGVNTVQAESGEAAIELYRSARRFDAVLMDLTMPGLDGAQTARELLSIDPRARIVFSSGYDQQALDAGFLNEAPRFIRKPYLLADIRAAFCEVLPLA